MSNTVSPAELGDFLDAVGSAPVALRNVPRINSILARLVGLANSKHPIGEVVPAEPSPVKIVSTPLTNEELLRRFGELKKSGDMERFPRDVVFGGTD